MTTTLQRETFITSRLLEYFTRSELAMQIGHGLNLWPQALGKELVDNGLDACESAGIAPEIVLALRDGSLVVSDNGPGIPPEIVTRSLDYAVRVSTNSRYVAPTRGQLGNALKTIWAAAFVLDGEHGHVEVEAPGTRHVVDVRLDRLAQAPKIEHQQLPTPERRNGTIVRMPWPALASLLDGRSEAGFYNTARFYTLAAAYAVFNPHLALTLELPESRYTWQAARPGWRKWAPSSPTSPHWYTTSQLSDLIAAYLVVERETGRVRTVRELIAEFRGLSSTAKQRAIADAAGLSGARLRDLCQGDEVDVGAVERLLTAMRAESKPVDGDQLGTIGRDAFAERLVRDFNVAPASFRHERVKLRLTGPGLEGTTIPVVLEVAFGTFDPGRSGNVGGLADRRLVLTGVNWSPTLEQAFPTLDQVMGEANIQPNDPIVLAVHLALPRVSFTDRGKTRLSVPSVEQHLADAVRKVARDWTKAKRQQVRISTANLRRMAAPQAKTLTIKAACFQVMEQAYLKASANGTLPAKGRQIMYAARPLVMALTGGQFYKADTQTFQQQVLPDFMEQHPDLTAG